jgi:hypothetical protein
VIKLEPGDWVVLVSMPNDPDPIPRGTCGKVERVVAFDGHHVQVEVAWESGRTLSLVIPPDHVVKLPYQHSTKKCPCLTTMTNIDTDCFCICHGEKHFGPHERAML